MIRTFNHRVMPLEWCAIILFLMGTLYGFWHRSNPALVVLGVLFLVLTTIALDRALHTSYIITDKQLIVKQGRVARTKYINIADITNVSKLPLAFRIGSYVLIELKNGKVVSLQPHNCKAFITAIHNLL